MRISRSSSSSRDSRSPASCEVSGSPRSSQNAYQAAAQVLLLAKRTARSAQLPDKGDTDHGSVDRQGPADMAGKFRGNQTSGVL